MAENSPAIPHRSEKTSYSVAVKFLVTTLFEVSSWYFPIPNTLRN